LCRVAVARTVNVAAQSSVPPDESATRVGDTVLDLPVDQVLAGDVGHNVVVAGRRSFT